jgi:protein-tyrosine phosphatase
MIQESKLYWVKGSWPGRVAFAARPRGGDWLPDELANWRQAGINTILSLLTREEEQELDLANEASEAQAHGLRFISFPIPDRQAPSSEEQLRMALENIEKELASGKNALIHCRQGIGRAGLVAACLLVNTGLSAKAALRQLSEIRGVEIPETTAQRRWIDHYASKLAHAK